MVRRLMVNGIEFELVFVATSYTQKSCDPVGQFSPMVKDPATFPEESAFGSFVMQVTEGDVVVRHACT